MIAVLKTCAKRAQRHSRYPRGPPAGTPHAPRDMALRSPPNREAESAIGVLRTALGRCKSEEGRGESAIGVLKTCAKRARRHSRYPRGLPTGTPHAPRDMALRYPLNREAESAIGVLRTALGRCKSEEGRGESAIGVLKMCAKRARRHSHYPRMRGSGNGVAQPPWSTPPWEANQ